MPSSGLCAPSPIGSALSCGSMSSSARIGNELARDRIARIGAVDELGDVGGQRKRIALCDFRRPRRGAAAGTSPLRPDHRAATAACARNA